MNGRPLTINLLPLRILKIYDIDSFVALESLLTSLLGSNNCVSAPTCCSTSCFFFFLNNSMFFPVKLHKLTAVKPT